MRHPYLPCFADHFGNVLSLLNFVGDQLFKLVMRVIRLYEEESYPLTSDILTDCESACDKESLVLPRCSLGFSAFVIGDDGPTCSSTLFATLLHRCRSFSCALDGRNGN